MQDDVLILGPTEHSFGAGPGFGGALACGAEYNPMHFEIVPLLEQLHECAAAADFDIVTVGAKAKNGTEVFEI